MPSTIASYASGVTAALLLPQPPQSLTWWAFLHIQHPLSCSFYCHGGRRTLVGWLPRSHRHLYLLGAIRLMGSTTAEGGGGWIVGSPVAGGMGSLPHCHCCQVTCGSGAAVIRLESHTATSLLLLGSLELWSQLPRSEGRA